MGVSKGSPDHEDVGYYMQASVEEVARKINEAAGATVTTRVCKLVRMEILQRFWEQITFHFACHHAAQPLGPCCCSIDDRRVRTYGRHNEGACCRCCQQQKGAGHQHCI